MKTVDLFAGAGGLSIGFEQAGGEIVAGIEWDRDATETFAKVHPSAESILGDIHQIDWRRWKGEADLVIGGPPCQPWSTGGLMLGANDPRDGWPAFIKAISVIKPRAFVAENVEGLATGRRKDGLKTLVDTLGGLGYRVSWKILNAADYGVPQKRRRLFIVGLRGSRGRPFEFPPATHGTAEREWVPAGQVVGSELVGQANKAVITYAKNPDLRPSPYDGHLFNGGGRPMDLSKPAPTMLASMGGNKTPWIDTFEIVPEYHAHLLSGGLPRAGRVPGGRRLSVEEAAAIQTFPLGMWFAGLRSSQYRQVGNAVPPLLARRVAEALLATRGLR
jgi:DNA (cytosine-5)-methyltransferase 1